MTFVRIAPPIPREVNLNRTYDAVVVGSGAAGSHALTPNEYSDEGPWLTPS